MEAHVYLALDELSFLYDNDSDLSEASGACWISRDQGCSWQPESLSEVRSHCGDVNHSETNAPQRDQNNEQNNASTTPIFATVLIPSHYVLCTRIEVPKKQQRHLERILPFLCEEKIANDLDDAHIAMGAVDQKTNQVAVRIIDRQLLETLLSHLNSHQIQVQRLLCTHELIASEQNTFWFDSEIACLGTADENITTEARNAVATIDSWYSTQPSDQLKSLELLSPLSELTTSMQLTIDQWRSQGASITVKLSADDGQCLADSWCRAARKRDITFDLATSHGIDLLCGDFQPKTIQSQTNRWQPFLQAASLLLVLNIAYLFGSGLYWESQAQTTHAESEALYREYFPKDKRIINIKTQTLNHLNQRPENIDAGALRLLTEFLPGWKEHKQHLKLKSLRYQQQRNELILEVEAKSIGQLDQLQQSLGKRAELMSANEDDGQGAHGRLRFKGSNG